MVELHNGPDTIEIGDIWLKVKVTLTQYQFLLHSSLLTFLLWIEAFLCPIKMKFYEPLTYVLGKFAFEFHKNRIGDEVIVTSFKFTQTNYHYLKFY